MDFTSQSGWSQSQNLFVDLDSTFDFYIFIAKSHILFNLEICFLNVIQLLV